MNKYESNDLIRVNKTVARELYNLGFTVGLCPCKTNPGSPWGLLVKFNHYDSSYDCDFNKLVSDFTNANCDSELGRYPAYYVKAYTYIHFSFEDGSNPYYFRGSAVDCMKELRRRAKNWIIEGQKEHFYKLEEKRL